MEKGGHGEEGEREGGVEEEEFGECEFMCMWGGGGGRLASSLICKKCITSEIKRKITAPKQNTQSRNDGEKRRWVGLEEVKGCTPEHKEGGQREGGCTCIDKCCKVVRMYINI